MWTQHLSLLWQGAQVQTPTCKQNRVLLGEKDFRSAKVCWVLDPELAWPARFMGEQGSLPFRSSHAGRKQGKWGGEEKRSVNV